MSKASGINRIVSCFLALVMILPIMSVGIIPVSASADAVTVEKKGELSSYGICYTGLWPV